VAAAAAVAVVGSAAAAASIPYTVGNGGPVNGVLARMTGITPSNLIGTGWEIATGVNSLICTEKLEYSERPTSGHSGFQMVNFSLNQNLIAGRPFDNQTTRL
jgi:hypothetical protein